MKRVIRVGILAAAIGPCAAIGQVYTGKIEGQQTSGDWSSFMVSRGDDVRIRAATVNPNTAALYIDFVLPTCGIMMEFSLPYSEASNSDIPASVLPASVRIDTGDVIDFSGLFNRTAMGDTSYILGVPKLADFGSLVSSMRAGQALRLKETAGTSNFYYAFSLRGFGAAYDRAEKACTHAANSGNGSAAAQAPTIAPRISPRREVPNDTAKWF